jgi:maltooligosyltrehalose trehalohydrolase
MGMGAPAEARAGELATPYACRNDACTTDAPMKELGAFPSEDGTIFRAWSTRARRMAVELEQQRGVFALEPAGDGVFEAHVPSARPGDLYKLRIDDELLPDPYARFLPQGVHGPAEIVKSSYSFAHPSRPVRDPILYELHIGTFTEEGTYRAAIERLPDLVRLGVTCLEIMPVSSFDGSRGWGYDGVAHFAPYAPYGRPDDLRALVDAAHGHGLSVILDVVYNHFGPAGNYLHAYSPEYFTKAYASPWGDSPDFTNPYMRQYLLANARYWLEDFRFDGLRLDATHAIHDPSPRHVLRELRESTDKMLIAEDERHDPALMTAVGIDAVWADEFHHGVRVLFTGEKDGYYARYQGGVPELARTIEQGWLIGEPAPDLAAQRFVHCVQNHDQIGNRAFGTRLDHDTGVAELSAATMLLLFLPMTPLLFMGQEWAASSPFLFFTDHHAELGAKVTEGRRAEFKHFAAFAGEVPDPQDEETFLKSRLRWEERTRLPHAEVLELTTRMIALRKSDPVLGHGAGARDRLSAEAKGDVLFVRRWRGEDERLLVISFGKDAPPPPSGYVEMLRSSRAILLRR